MAAGRFISRVIPLLLVGWLLSACQFGPSVRPPLVVGLIAPLSGPSAQSGEAIRRGMLLAVDEVNRDGGVLGRSLEIVAHDVQNDPAAGLAALHDLARRPDLVAVFGGSFSPVMLAQLDALHELQVPLINPWGSVNAITKNGRSPNYAFRVSLCDETADEFLTRYAVDVLGVARPGILADTTAWGESNASGLAHQLDRRGLPRPPIERFSQGDVNMTRQLAGLREAGVDALFLIANAPEGAAVVRGLSTLGWQVPVISHWGISGGDFVKLAGIENAEGVLTIQTFSFLTQPTPRSEAVLRAYHARFGTRRVEEVVAPVGVAHGYDGLHLLAGALRQAGSPDRPAVRDALEHLGPYDGLVKRYDPPFTPENHDALTAEDYLMAVWRDGRLVPDDWPRLP